MLVSVKLLQDWTEQCLGVVEVTHSAGAIVTVDKLRAAAMVADDVGEIVIVEDEEEN